MAAALVWGWFFAPQLVTTKSKTKPSSKAVSGKQAASAVGSATKANTNKGSRVQAEVQAGKARSKKKD